MSFFRARQLLLATVIVLAACSKKEDTGAPLAYVPADTPYVAANVEPPGDALVQQWSKQMHAMWPIVVQSVESALDDLDKAAQTTPADGDDTEDGDDAKMPALPAKSVATARAIFAELKDRDTVEKWQEIGFTPKARSALYGVGALPVLRLELGDPEKFRALIARLETKAGAKLATAKLDQQDYWILAESDAVLPVMAIEGKHLVLTLLPAKGSDDLKRRLLGLAKPAKSLADTGALAKLNDVEHYLPIGSGWIDVQRIAALVADGDPTLTELAQSTGKPLPPVDATCKQELAALVAHVPRFVFGYTAFEARRMAMHGRLELDAALAADLTKALVPAPGGDLDANAVIDLGIAMPLMKLRSFVAARVDQILASPYRCSELAELNDGAKELKPKLDQFLPPPASDLLGVRATLTKFAFKEGMIPEMAGKLLVATDNPSFLLGMAQLSVPALKDLKVAPDGKPVALPAAALPMDVGGVSVAMNDKALAIAIGPGQAEGLGAYLAVPASGTLEFVRMGYGGELYGMYGDLFKKLAATMPPDQAAKLEQQQKMFEFYRTWFKRADFRMSASAKGIEFASATELNE